ncbi:conserved hypothetical protein [Candidatus Protochlamydia naegleriophila]|uniref:Peptidase C39-like domain-containing protein n=1 Tax=Candidatus Protochlamydia naegleriophila TaxID=389348 RepID=A0A0U5JD66_9BACT|nr:C39 family peptidase [Candidatus Protochlamydia naegleriophila]CUI17053.1 conserved hypothetical protein [Candidatus Protochlamydia naegleriophila]
MRVNFTQVYHHHLSQGENHHYEWELDAINPFNELIISWNALRPENGRFLVFASLKIGVWSKWLPYASWGAKEQASFDHEDEHLNCRTFQDLVSCMGEKKATGFRVRVEVQEGAQFEHFIALHACASAIDNLYLETTHNQQDPLLLDVPPLSQMALTHPRNQSFCSPVSTTATIRFLTKEASLHPLSFAQKVHDSRFDIYGNWSFSVAQAFIELGQKWHCWVARFASLNQVIDQLKDGIPLVVSVKGPLPGSAQSYNSGHLIVIKGFNPLSQQIICMDPAFQKDSETTICYDLQDFIQAWQRRLFVAYVFRPLIKQNITLIDKPL